MRDLVISLHLILHTEPATRKCVKCGCSDAEEKFSWRSNGSTPFSCFQVALGTVIVTEKSFKINCELLGTKYKLFGYTVLYHDHFTAVVYWRKHRYIYDGIHSKTLQDYTP